ncbi:MAG TPA: hypothetical protein VN158_14380 [Caulobacter sp.]|nr:hypothetical protein [Caulobacter sp.]
MAKGIDDEVAIPKQAAASPAVARAPDLGRAMVLRPSDRASGLRYELYLQLQGQSRLARRGGFV